LKYAGLSQWETGYNHAVRALYLQSLVPEAWPYVPSSSDTTNLTISKTLLQHLRKMALSIGLIRQHGRETIGDVQRLLALLASGRLVEKITLPCHCSSPQSPVPTQPQTNQTQIKIDHAQSEVSKWEQRREEVNLSISKCKQLALELENMCELHLQASPTSTLGTTTEESPTRILGTTTEELEHSTPSRPLQAAAREATDQIIDVACLLLSCVYGRKMDSTKSCEKVTSHSVNLDMGMCCRRLY
jgi:hypothetical protein